MKFRLFLSLLLTALLLFSLVQTVAFAAADTGTCGDQVTYTLDETGLLTISGAGEMTDYFGPASPFYGKMEIKHVTITPGVSGIGNYLFGDCTGITEVSIPDSVLRIGDSAFSGCTALAAVSLPAEIAVIGPKAFYHCVSLTSAEIPEKVSFISESVFDSCTSLLSVTIPAGVTEIDYAAFSGCQNLKDVYFGGTQEQWATVKIQKNNAPLLNAELHCEGSTPHEHTWDSGAQTKASTCAIEGEMTYTCTECGETKTEPIAKLTTHTWDAGREAKAPTCAEEGQTLFTCTVCGAEKTAPIAKINRHVWDDGNITVQPSCTSFGELQYTCTLCGATRQEAVQKLPHSWDQGHITKPATTEAEGEITYTCTLCKTEKKESIPKLQPLPQINTENAKETEQGVLVLPGCTAAELLANAGSGASITKADGSQPDATAPLASGMTLTKANGEKKTIIVKGDITGDGKITAADARSALRQAVGLDDSGAWQKIAAKVTAGEKVTAADARRILRAAVGLETLTLNG